MLVHSGEERRYSEGANGLMRSFDRGKCALRPAGLHGCAVAVQVRLLERKEPNSRLRPQTNAEVSFFFFFFFSSQGGAVS